MMVSLGCRRLLVLFALIALMPTGYVGAAQALPAARILLLDGARAGDRIIAVGERGHILWSDDSGRTWNRSQVPATATLTAITFVDSQLGWAVGHDAIILHTADGGLSWIEQHAAPEWELPLLDIYFIDARTGFAVGAYGLFLETGDGGISWTRRILTEDDLHLNAIVAPSQERLVIAGEAGRILLSSDEFRTITILDLPSAGSLFGGVPLSEDELLVFGLRGRVYRSVDGGRSWQRVHTDVAAGLLGGTVLADGQVVLAGVGGAVLTSGDRASSFASSRQADRPAFAAVIEAPDGALVLLGEQGVRRLEPTGITAASHRH